MKTLADQRGLRDKPNVPFCSRLRHFPPSHLDVFDSLELLPSPWADFILCPSFGRWNGPTRAMLGFMHGFDTVPYGAC